MYKNLGYTIKSLARIAFWVVLAVAELAGVVALDCVAGATELEEAGTTVGGVSMLPSLSKELPSG